MKFFLAHYLAKQIHYGGSQFINAKKLCDRSFFHHSKQRWGL